MPKLVVAITWWRKQEDVAKIPDWRGAKKLSLQWELIKIFFSTNPYRVGRKSLKLLAGARRRDMKPLTSSKPTLLCADIPVQFGPSLQDRLHGPYPHRFNGPKPHWPWSHVPEPHWLWVSDL